MAYLVLYIFSLVLSNIFYLAQNIVYKSFRVSKINLKKLFKFEPNNSFGYLILGFIFYSSIIDGVLEEKSYNQNLI